MWEYPESRKSVVTDQVHGRKIVDPFRWLEDSESSEVAAWSAAQNEFTKRVIRTHGQPDKYLQELAELCAVDSFSLPIERNGWYLWSERKSGENQASVYRRSGLQGAAECVLDANALSDDGTVTISSWNVSQSGRYLSFALSAKGAEMGTLYVRDLTSEDARPIDEIPHVRYPRVIWTTDESSFYVTRHPAPGTVPVGDEQYYDHLYFHKLSSPWADDLRVFGEGRHKEDMLSLSRSTDRQQIVISAGRNWVSNEIYVLDVQTNTVVPVIEGLDGLFDLDIVNGRAYLYTNFQSEFGRLLSFDTLDLPKRLEEWHELIPERKGEKLSGTWFTSESMLVHRMIDGESHVEICDHSGRHLRQLELPESVSLTAISCREDRAEYFYGYTSYLEPTAQYRSADVTSAPEPYRAVELGEDMSPYTVSKVIATSKDGTRVPVALVHAKSLHRDGTNPTLLYGYGGFNHIQSPEFVRGMLPFIKRGGIYAVAIIRGGGEGGSAWHQTGIGHHKQNSFDDFIAAAEALMAQGYTSPEKLAIMGGSNGGLLVGACATQRPELYKAVVCSVPLLDMVRFPNFLIASRWTSEYGDPSVIEDFHRIITWSPYHNVKPKVAYPAWLLLTSDHDTRVEPLHARKMAALLQSRGDTRPVLLRTQIDAGHGAGTSLSKWIESHSDILAFLDWQLEM